MSRRWLLFMVGVLTMVVALAAFAMPAIANEDIMALNTPELPEGSEIEQPIEPITPPPAEASVYEEAREFAEYLCTCAKTICGARERLILCPPRL